MKDAAGIVAACLWATALQAQDFPVRDLDPERWIEESFAVQNLDLDYERLYENLLMRLSQPLDINKATTEELRSLLILSEKQVTALVEYRKSMGPFLSVYELQAVPDLDVPTLYRLMPLIRVIDSSQSIDQHLLARAAHEDGYFLVRTQRCLEDKEGYLKSTDAGRRYAGSPDKACARLRVSRPGDFSYGFALEKDAGESFRWNPSKQFYGIDFLSGHAQLIHKGRIQNLIVGDFQAQFGQGLVLGGGFGIGKGAESVTTIRRGNLGFSPYTALNEFGFFRGIGLSTRVARGVTAHVFASQLRRDGSVAADTSDLPFIASLGTTGYHRTQTELSNRKQVTEKNAGVVLSYQVRRLETGVIVHHTEFSLPVLRPRSLYNQFAFSGSANTNLSAFLNYSAGSVAFFSEAARTMDHGNAFVAGILASLAPRLDASVLFRSFDRNFQSPYSNALAENSVAQNERGMYWGLKFVPDKKFTFTGYIDLFRFPWLRYRSYSPNEGSEWLMKLTYQPGRGVLVYVQAREECKDRNTSDAGPQYLLQRGIKRNGWLHAEAKAGRLTIRSRVQFSSYRLGTRITRGIAIAQDLILGLGRLNFAARYALFDTDDYDNRLYVYERDTWLSLSLPPYYGKGIRTYAMVQWSLSRSTDVWLRWAQTRYVDRNTIGSGLETIYGNVINDIKLQVRVRF